MKLELAIMAGAESKVWLADLTKQIDRLEKLSVGGKASKAVKADADEDADEEDETDAPESSDDDEDEDFGSAKKKAAKKTKAAFDQEDEEEDDAADSDDVEEEEDAPPAKASKAKKLTLSDVNQACKDRASRNGGGKEGRAKVLAILKKKFKTETVSELKPEQYAACVAAMA